MVALLQQCVVLGGLLVATAWTVHWWDRSWPVAVAGIVALVLLHAVVLAIEFAVSYVVNARDPLPRAAARQCVRAWLAESAIALRVFAWRQPFRSKAVPDHLQPDGRRGVVLVHGFLCNRGFWNPWLRRLRAEGHAFVAVDLEPVSGSIDRYPQVIDAAVARVTAATALPPILVCHSMGGLAARAWVRQGEGRRVHHVVTIGTPHRGTWLARFGHSTNGREMRVGGPWMQRLDEAEGAAHHEPPSTCWYSNCDNIVFPISNATLPRADNRLLEGQGHVEMAFDPRVTDHVLMLLAR